MVEPESADAAFGQQAAQSQFVGRGKNLRIIHPQAGQVVDVEKSAVIDFLGRNPPIRQPVSLRFQQPMQGVEAAGIAAAAPFAQRTASPARAGASGERSVNSRSRRFRSGDLAPAPQPSSGSGHGVQRQLARGSNRMFSSSLRSSSLGVMPRAVARAGRPEFQRCMGMSADQWASGCRNSAGKSVRRRDSTECWPFSSSSPSDRPESEPAPCPRSSALTGCQSMSKKSAYSEARPFSSTSCHHGVSPVAHPHMVRHRIRAPVPCREPAARLSARRILLPSRSQD